MQQDAAVSHSVLLTNFIPLTSLISYRRDDSEIWFQHTIIHV